MREIKFRGRTSHGSWAFGLLTKGFANTWIVTDDFVSAWVDPETVGQYTGLKDRSGVEIYEGDVVKYHPEMNAGIGRVVYEGSGFYVTDEFNGLLDDFATMGIEIIGNIHDNPELLEEEQSC